ncbi:MAG: hypothetical protein AAF004_06075 [Pseudomonadota bacterium]
MIIMALMLSSRTAYCGEKSLEIDQAEVAKNAPTAKTMEFKAGNILSLISSAPKAGVAAAAVRNRYAKTAFSLAGTFGLRPAGSLTVTDTVAGSFTPAAVSFFSWPSVTAERDFRAHPDWAAIKATRPQGWDELRIHDVVLTKDLTVTFHADKTYTMATAWINPEHPGDYDLYLSNIVPAVTASGGRFIYQMRDPQFNALATQIGAPSRVTLVEWESQEGLSDFLNTDGYKDNAHYMQRGVTAFELVVLD